MSNNRFFMVQPDAGLGNRLNNMYSGLYFAKQYQTKLHILWLRENCCNADFTDIFEIPDDVVIHTIYNLGYKNKYVFKTIASKIYMMWLKRRLSYYDAGMTRRYYDANGEDGMDRLIADNESLCLMSSGPFCTGEKLSTVRNALIPTKEIQSLVDKIMSPYAAMTVYGIHIRRTDHVNAIEHSPLELFTNICDELSGENVIFYVATDDAKTMELLCSKYKVIPHITYCDRVNRNSAEGIKDAYVDMLCLSRCKTIYGSFESTFSVMASFIGNTELVVLK